MIGNEINEMSLKFSLGQENNSNQNQKMNNILLEKFN